MDEQKKPVSEQNIPEVPVEPVGGSSDGASSAPAFDSKDVEENKVIAALSYLGLLVLVPLLAKRDSPFVQFHARQGLVLLIVFMGSMFVVWVPVIGQLLWLALVVVNVIALVKTLMGQSWKLPFIGDLADKFKI
ncbi:MAG: hypothetical protein KC736_02530 [Candidatus Moranbacteria bacterium]|nr:hypothetical protein [Candidatus Moranbacteria bacterium]